MEQQIREILAAMGENPDREGLKDTPRRVTKMWKEMTEGYHMDPKKLLKCTFKEDAGIEHPRGEANYMQPMVIVRDIAFYSHCEHHMVPFFGKVHIGYIPNGKVVGISKLARLVDVFARRLQIQERLTKQIADTITEELAPQGVMVIVEAEHLCMKMRGIKNPCADTVTSACRGLFAQDATRAEFLQLIRRG